MSEPFTRSLPITPRQQPGLQKRTWTIRPLQTLWKVWAGDLRDKAIAVASVIRNMEADAKAIREAICDMESRLTRIETRTVGLREYLLTTLQATNIRKVECPWFAVSEKKTRHGLLSTTNRYCQQR